MTQIETGKMYRDENDFSNRWVRVLEGPDQDGFCKVAPINGDEPYEVYEGSLTPNAHLSRAQVDRMAS